MPAWIAASAIISGWVFRSVDRQGRLGEGLSTRAVEQLVQRRAARAGLDRTVSRATRSGPGGERRG